MPFLLPLLFSYFGGKLELVSLDGWGQYSHLLHEYPLADINQVLTCICVSLNWWVLQYPLFLSRPHKCIRVLISKESKSDIYRLDF